MTIINNILIKGGACLRASLLCVITTAVSLGANAETVLLQENFDHDYSANFSMYDGDGLMPAKNIQAFFLSNVTGTYMPWWHLKESSGATDRFISSHSYYTPAAQSDDWLISRAIEVPTKGFILEFDAQSVNLRGTSYLSDLTVYVTEQMPGEDYMPDFEPAAVYEQVPTGATLDVTTDEWTRYTLSLDPWEGKTVHVSFVNRNYNKDLLCIDNVKVSRYDTGELVVDPVPEYVVDGEVPVTFTVKAIGGDLKDWEVVFEASGQNQTFSGASLADGEQVSLSAAIELDPMQSVDYSVTLTADGLYPVVETGNVTRLAFATTRRVLLEETTGLWCSNCTRGIYNIESLVQDPEISEYVVPVSVHIKGAMYDMMTMDEYADNLGLSSAPLVRINRQENVAGFTSYDNNYDPTNPNTFGYRIYNEVKEIAFFDIDVDGEWVTTASGDTTAIKIVAKVRPALDFADPDRYRVGFILTENNVGLDNSPFWVQENGVSGYPIESKLGGWTELPPSVINMRYQFVARAISRFGGIPGSFSELRAGEEYTVEYTIDIPDTYSESSLYGVTSGAVRPQLCEVTAYIVDTADKTIANCARHRMSDEEYDLFTAEDLVRILSVDDIAVDAVDADPAIYDLHGRCLSPDGNTANLAPGIYIRNNTKVVVR